MIVFKLTDELVVHERKIYGILDVFGDFGGVQEVITALASLALGQIASHAFLTKAISKLYIAKTKDDSIFQRKKSVKALAR
jgi:hypothetical protein